MTQCFAIARLWVCFFYIIAYYYIVFLEKIFEIIMNLEDFRQYCLSKPGTSEDLPFDENTLVFRVGTKIFALTNIDDPTLSVNLKCDPERAIELRENYEGITPGYHMNKKHWNTVVPDNTISDNLLIELTDHSYDLVLKSLKKVDRERIQK